MIKRSILIVLLSKFYSMSHMSWECICEILVFWSPWRWSICVSMHCCASC